MDLSFETTSTMISSDESHLSWSSAELDFSFKVWKVRQCCCIWCGGEKGHVMRWVLTRSGGSGLFVLGKNRKHAPDKTRLSSQNKVSGSFERSHGDFIASPNIPSDWQAGLRDRKGDGGQINNLNTHMSAGRSPNSRAPKCMHTLRLEGGNLKSPSFLFEVFNWRGTVQSSAATLVIISGHSSARARARPGAIPLNTFGSTSSEGSHARCCCSSSDSSRISHCFLPVEVFALRWKQTDGGSMCVGAGRC